MEEPPSLLPDDSASRGILDSSGRPELTDAEITNSLYDPWRHAYTPRRFEVVLCMSYGNSAMVVLAVNRRRQEALLRPLNEELWPLPFRRVWEPFSMIRKYYNRSGGHKNRKRKA